MGDHGRLRSVGTQQAKEEEGVRVMMKNWIKSDRRKKLPKVVGTLSSKTILVYNDLTFCQTMKMAKMINMTVLFDINHVNGQGFLWMKMFYLLEDRSALRPWYNWTIVDGNEETSATTKTTEHAWYLAFLPKRIAKIQIEKIMICSIPCDIKLRQLQEPMSAKTN